MIAQTIGWDVAGDRCVTTAMVPRYSLFSDHLVETYETIIWMWDEETKQRTRMLDFINHANEQDAKKVHGYIVKNLTKRIEN